MKLGDTVVFGSYQQQPIEWFVVGMDQFNNNCTLLSRYALDVVKYNKDQKKATWANCTLNDWLNSNFLNSAFSTNELYSLIQTKVEDSQDYVWIPSAAELESWLSLIGNTAAVKGTSFCSTRNTVTGTPIYVNSNTGTSSWWLRSPSTTKKAEFVTGAGKIGGGNNPPDVVDNGVRPVVKVNLDWFRQAGH